MAEAFFQPQATPDHEAIARMFDDMAARIRLNKDAKFGGALLLVPPGGLGKPIAHLLLSDQEAGYYWSSIKGMIDSEYRNVEELARSQRARGY